MTSMAAMNPNNPGADAMGLRWAYTDSLKWVVFELTVWYTMYYWMHSYGEERQIYHE
jgi:hypothetical protein